MNDAQNAAQLEKLREALQRKIPGTTWVVRFGRVEAEVYGTFFTAEVSGYNAFVSVGGVRRSRPLRDADDVADLMQDTIVRRWRALGRALGV